MRKALSVIPMAIILLLTVGCGAADNPQAAPSETVEATQSTSGPSSEEQSSEPASPESPDETTESPSGHSGEPSDGSTSSSAPSDDQTAERVLSHDGLGPFKIGDTNMVERGAMELEPECGIYVSTPEYSGQGIHFALDPNSDAGEKAPLAEVTVRALEPGGEPIGTPKHATAGMTFETLKELYPEATEEVKNGNGGPFQAFVVREGDRELVFQREDFSTDPIEDSQEVAAMTARTYSPDMFGSC